MTKVRYGTQRVGPVDVFFRCQCARTRLTGCPRSAAAWAGVGSG
ncbi:hypothetical protein SAMN05421684_7353 [Asanoa ishikariensis]|uniref:Uncharacterized protein n=1 Tax=Asanoa ishikariensis TaxID=137265 RepID=A0A1H3UHQ6_9ACTN|nr:hypothetical protein SAMN05421684_7353 [Asanoa ishikariensis]